MKAFPKILSLHKETQKLPHISPNSDTWPKEWKIIEYKSYPRFPSYKLPDPKKIETSFSGVLLSRKSERDFDISREISSQELGDFLYWSAGIKDPKAPEGKEDIKKRFYPSGGARFSLEIYFAFSGNKEIPRGLYHYNVLSHSVERLLGEDGDKEIRDAPTYSFVKEASLVFIITGTPRRLMQKYKERGYRYMIIEVGILLQNMYLVATGVGLKICGVGSDCDDFFEKILDIDGITEQALLFCAAGK